MSGPDCDLVRAVGEIALDLHMNRPDELSSTLPPESPQPFQKETDDYFIDGKTVSFSSVEARNRCVATYVFEKNQQAFANDMQMWLSTAFELWKHESGNPDSAAGRLLALVDERKDLFSIAATALENKSIQVLNVLHVVEAALPYLEKVSVNGIVNLCIAQFERTKDNTAISILFSNLEKMLVAHPKVCREIHSRIRSNAVEATTALHSLALLSLAQSSTAEAVRLALEDAESSDVILKTAALWTLRLLFKLPMLTAEMLHTVSVAIIKNMSDAVERVRQTAISVAAHVAPTTEVFDEPLTRLGESGDQHALAEIANTLMMNKAGMKDKAHFNEWVRLLCKLSPRTKWGVDSFDHVLYQLISDESQQQFAIACLTDWIHAHAEDMENHKVVTKLFDSTASELAKHPALLSQTITDWFLSDNWRVTSAAAGLLSYLWVHGRKSLEFNSSRLDTLDHNDLLFLARRMLGYVSSEDHLISLAMSFLKTKDAPQRTFGIVRSLLVDELGQDYPASTVETLEAAKSSITESEWLTFYSSIIEKIDGHMKTLEALPRLTELRPPPSLQRQFVKARAKQMSEAAEEASKGSIIQQLATKIPIKAGIGWFNFHDGSYSSPSYMKSFSQSISLPRRLMLDEVGYEISRFFMRLAKRGEA